MPYIGVVVGIVVLASPIIANVIEKWRAAHTISQVTTVVEHVDAGAKEELLAQAHAYNHQHATHTAVDGVWPYERQLVAGPSGDMCWIEIPRIDVRLAIHHGTDDAALASGAGHLKGTSLPVGGESTHCVISAHSGMPTARIFDDIRDLVPGDVFVIWTLDDPYAYKVLGSETVDPDDVSSFTVQQGRDLCTLVTCTPYGVNSQRLLVHAERCPYEDASGELPPVMYVGTNAWPLVVGLVLAGGALAVTSLRVITSWRHKAAGS